MTCETLKKVTALHGLSKRRATCGSLMFNAQGRCWQTRLWLSLENIVWQLGGMGERVLVCIPASQILVHSVQELQLPKPVHSTNIRHSNTKIAHTSLIVVTSCMGSVILAVAFFFHSVCICLAVRASSGVRPSSCLCICFACLFAVCPSVSACMSVFKFLCLFFRLRYSPNGTSVSVFATVFMSAIVSVFVSVSASVTLLVHR